MIRQMTKEIIETLRKVADIKYDLQVVLDTLYQLDNETMSNATITAATVGAQFMDIMDDYQTRQQRPKLWPT